MFKYLDKPTTLGILIVLLWTSYIPRLFPTPFQPNPGIKSLAEEVADAPEFIKKEIDREGYNADDFEVELTRSFRFLWAKLLLTISIGILSGILIIKRTNIGRILAIVWFILCAIIPVLYSFLKYGLIKQFKLRYLALTEFPFASVTWNIMYDDFVTIVAVIAVIYMLRPTFAKEFKT